MKKDSAFDFLKKIFLCIMFKLYLDKIKLVELNAIAGQYDQMTAINSTRCYLRIFFVRKSFGNSTQNNLLYNYLSNW